LHKRIGILGGVSAESTRTYYEHITREYTKRYGDYSYPEMIIYSVSFQEFVDWHYNERWDLSADKMIVVFKALEKAGADFGVIAANTLHLVFDQVQKAISIPLLSIIDATAEAIEENGVTSVGLLGTIFTMNKDFYRKGLETRGISTLVPEPKDQELVNRVIYEELTRGIINDGSRSEYIQIMKSLTEKGADGIVLGCTEIPLLIKDKDCDVPLFDTTLIHAKKALDYAVAGNSTRAPNRKILPEQE
jgi:aspartate racemase